MIRSFRCMESLKLQAYLRNHALVHTHFRVHAVDNARVISEDQLLFSAFERVGQNGRPVITVLLEGSACIRSGARVQWLSPGDLLGMDAKGHICMRQQGEPYRSLVLEWDVDWLGPRPAPFTHVHLADRELSRARGIWLDITRSEQPQTAPVAALLQLLREQGIPLLPRAEQELAEPVDDQILRLSRGLDEVLSRLDSQPMSVDLEEVLQLSSRQVNRLVQAFNIRYGFNSLGWRDTRNRRRVMLGATLMTAPGATAEEVAALVGYSSLSAFSRALSIAGLPPPSEILRRVQELAGDL